MKPLLGILSVSLLMGASVARAEGPTFNKDVAPILWKNCAGCHRPGEVGPFSLLNYADAARRVNRDERAIYQDRVNRALRDGPSIGS